MADQQPEQPAPARVPTTDSQYDTVKRGHRPSPPRTLPPRPTR